MKDRELCYAYLMDEMSESARSRFDERLVREGSLATVLCECETDLADFAEANTADLAPPPRVWESILEDLREPGEKVTLPEKSGRYLWSDYGKWAWPVAAALLIGLNVWQYLGNGAAVETETQEASSSIDGSTPALVAMDYEEVMEELRSLQDRIEELDSERNAAEQGMNLNRDKVVVLETEKESMRRRIEYLESNYLSLIELANPVLTSGNTYFGGDVVEMVQAEADEDKEGVVGDIWSHMSSLLKEPGVAQIPLMARVTIPETEAVGEAAYLRTSSFESFRNEINAAPADAELEWAMASEAPESFAVAYLNKDTGQAILSVANVKMIAPEQNYTVWVRGEEGSGYRNMGSLDSLSGNIGVQLPAALEGRPEFLISVEEGVDSTAPSENVVLVTKEEG